MAVALLVPGMLPGRVLRRPRDDATRHLNGEAVKPHPEKPRRGAFQPSIFAISHSFDGREALIDNGELSSFTDLLSALDQ
jgi:hypothetical protein